MKTRDRILLTSLALFNEIGESKVSTNHIANEMDISPGNLYYYFRNKDDIIKTLFTRFRQRFEQLLIAPADRALDMEDMWFFLHLIFELIWEYRFLYRGLADLTGRNRSFRTHFNRIVVRKISVADKICHDLVNAGIMQAQDDEIRALSESIALVATYSLTFATIRQRTRVNNDDVGTAVYQVMSLVAPYLREPERGHLRELARAYL